MPEVIGSDNGPEFDSSAFKKFAKHYGFKHITSSPRYPQSNDPAERAAQGATNKRKKLMERIFTSPCSTIAKVHWPNWPDQVLLGRRIRTQLSTTPTLLEPQYPTQRIKQGLAGRARNQEMYYNQHFKELKPLSKWDPVPVRKPGQRICSSDHML